MNKQFPLIAFVVLAYTLSWIPWLVLVVSRQELIDQPVSQYLHLVGSLGPLLAAVLVTAATSGIPGVRDLVSRMGRWRVGAGWVLLAVAAPAALYGVAVVIARGLEGAWPDISQFGRSDEYPALSIWAYWLANIVFYGFGEEVGWRGFVLPRLQRRNSALRSSVLVSIIWAFWHLPLFGIPESMESLGLVGIPGWYFSLLLGSVLVTWLYNSTGGSILIVALFHGTLDIVINTPGIGAMVQNLMGAMLTVWGFGVLHWLGPDTLSRRRKQQV